MAAIALALAQLGPAFAQPTREAPPPGQAAARPAPPPSTRPAPPPSYRPPPPRPETKPYPPPSYRPPPPPPYPTYPPGYRPPPGWNRPGNPPAYWPGWGHGGWGGDWYGWGGGYRQIDCESRDGRYRRCGAYTQGRAGIVRVYSSTPCRQGRSWGYTRDFIWVDNGCRARFAYGYGGDGYYYGDNDNTAKVIAGVAVAAGLLAILSASSRSASDSRSGGTAAPGSPPAPPAPPPPPQPAPQLPPSYTPRGPATISADYGSLPADAQAPMRTCLADVARQVGATGGTAIRFEGTRFIEKGNGGYRFRATIPATYPDSTRDLGIFCRATPTTVIELQFEPV